MPRVLVTYRLNGRLIYAEVESAWTDANGRLKCNMPPPRVLPFAQYDVTIKPLEDNDDEPPTGI